MRKVARPEELVRADVLDQIRHGPLVRVGRNPALAVEIVARQFFERHAASQRRLVGTVHAVQQMPDPAGARLQHDDLDRGKAVEQPVLEEPQKRLLRPLSAEHVHPPLAPFVHLAEALIDAPVGRLGHRMDADRHAQILGRGPERIVVLVGMGLVGQRVGRHERALGPPSDGTLQLLRRGLARRQADVRDGNQPAARVRAEIDDPAVVGAGIGLGQGMVGHLGLPLQTDGGIDEGFGEMLPVEQFQPLLGVVAAERDAVGIGLLLDGVALLERAAHAAPAGQNVGVEVARTLPVEFQVVQPVRPGPDADRAIPEFGIDVAFPQVRGLVDVAVGVDGPVVGEARCLEHGSLPAERRVRMENSVRVRNAGVLLQAAGRGVNQNGRWRRRRSPGPPDGRPGRPVRRPSGWRWGVR